MADEDADECIGGVRAPVHGEPDGDAGDGERRDAAQHVCGAQRHDGAGDLCEEDGDAVQGGMEQDAVAHG